MDFVIVSYHPIHWNLVTLISDPQLLHTPTRGVRTTIVRVNCVHKDFETVRVYIYYHVVNIMHISTFEIMGNHTMIEASYKICKKNLRNLSFY
jgi:hypothetical protein